jgi:antitoxin VapB
MSATAKVFMSGRSQAVRLPKEFRFDVDEVQIERTPAGILLRAKSPTERLKGFFDRLEPFPSDFLVDRNEGLVEDLSDPFADVVMPAVRSPRKAIVKTSKKIRSQR